MKKKAGYQQQVREKWWRMVACWGMTCVHDDSHGFFGVADGAASQQQVVFVKCISFTTSVDSVRSEYAQTMTQVLVHNTNRQTIKALLLGKKDYLCLSEATPRRLRFIWQNTSINPTLKHHGLPSPLSPGLSMNSL